MEAVCCEGDPTKHVVFKGRATTYNTFMRQKSLKLQVKNAVLQKNAIYRRISKGHRILAIWHQISVAIPPPPPVLKMKLLFEQF